VSDVKELLDWNAHHMEIHPLFERVSDEENKNDPCIKFMTEGTDEAKKVIRNEGTI
jgi:tRNA (guanine-N7-)-methyltransferase